MSSSPHQHQYVTHALAGIPGAIAIHPVGRGHIGLRNLAVGRGERVIRLSNREFAAFVAHIQAGNPAESFEGTVLGIQTDADAYAIFNRTAPAESVKVSIFDLELFLSGIRLRVFDHLLAAAAPNQTTPTRHPALVGARF